MGNEARETHAATDLDMPDQSWKPYLKQEFTVSLSSVLWSFWEFDLPSSSLVTTLTHPGMMNTPGSVWRFLAGYPRGRYSKLPESFSAMESTFNGRLRGNVGSQQWRPTSVDHLLNFRYLARAWRVFAE